LIVDPGKQFGGDTRTTVQRANLRVLSDGAEGVLRAGGIRRTRLASEMNREIGAGRGVFRAIGPRVIGAVAHDVHGIQQRRWVAGPLEAFGTFLADADTPRWLIPRGGAEGEQQDWEVRGLRRSRRGGGR